MLTEKNEITSMALGCKLLDAGYVSHQRYSNKESLVGNGQVNFSNFPNGMHIHTSDLIECQRATSSVELSPCLSISVLFKGQVSFSLGQHLYDFDCLEQSHVLDGSYLSESLVDSSCVIFAYVTNSPELFTRHLNKQQHVKKLNVSIDKSWLLKRCQNQQDKQKIEDIFSHHNRVFQLSQTQQWLDLAKKMMSYDSTASMLEKIKFEQYSWQLLHLCLSALEKDDIVKIPSSEISQVSSNLAHSQSKLNQFEVLLEKHLLDNSVPNKLSLEDLSIQLGISISSLQRYFKAKYNMTAKEYIRNKRLAQARKLIIIDSLSIGEVAFVARYNHVSSFITAFKKHFGITPAELRRQHFG